MPNCFLRLVRESKNIKYLKYFLMNFPLSTFLRNTSKMFI